LNIACSIFDTMISRGYFLFLIFFILPLIKAQAQFQYYFDQDISVVEGNSSLEMPWVGGLNLAQYNELDINNDGITDLFVFDRHSRKPYCFISDGTRYTYAPEFEHFFPTELEHWVLLRDFNCDGKNDIFTASLFGMSLYENISQPNGVPEWELKYMTIFTEGNSGQVNLQVNKGDLPGIQDIDGDGDLDILVFDFALGGGIQLHQNMSVERTGTCDMDMVLMTEMYGNFMECTCTDYVFGGDPCPVTGRLEHTGGKSILSFANANTTVQDLVVGQEDCIALGFLENSGSAGAPDMTSVRFDFPDSNNPSTLNFPATFHLDLDFDGINDLLITNNIFAEFGNPDFAANNWYYKGDGQNFTLTTRALFQDQMIDGGYGAAPVFYDIDGDGDEDLLVGTESLSGSAPLKLYRNTGDALNPQLQLDDADYLSLVGQGVEKVAPQITDINEDGRKDLVINLGIGGIVRVYTNTGNTFQPFTEADFITLQVPVIGTNDNLHFYKATGKPGLLIGRETGRLSQYVNQGSVYNPIWELITDNYLGIVDDFTARNLAVFIDDMDLDGREDLLRYDDSGVLRIYSDFRNEALVFEQLIQDKQTFLSYNSSFGRNGLPVTTKITGAERPSIVMGMVGGGLQILSNIEDEQQAIDVPVRLATFPNPLSRSEQLSVVTNKAANLRILNAQGQVFIQGVEVVKNQRISFDLSVFRAGLYLIEATDSDGGKAVSRVVVSK
jgi:hypothetical protein